MARAGVDRTGPGMSGWPVSGTGPARRVPPGSAGRWRAAVGDPWLTPNPLAHMGMFVVGSPAPARHACCFSAGVRFAGGRVRGAMRHFTAEVAERRQAVLQRIPGAA